MVWDKEKILNAVRKLHKQGSDLSYGALAKKQQALLSASAYHFGSYRKAIERAGIDYGTLLRRPRWSKTAIIRLIKEGRRSGFDLHWSAVTKRKDELGKAAFASLQPRLFGRWDRALLAAGLDADEINLYRKWDRNTIVADLRARARDSEPVNSGGLQKDDPGLHAATLRYFGKFDQALLAAKLDPERIRQRRIWEKADVIRELKLLKRGRARVTDALVRKGHPALYGAALRLFGSFPLARDAAGLKA